MYKIYLLKDINGLEYVGKWDGPLKYRLKKHRYARDKGQYISSQKINLDNCEIILLEECDKSVARKREQYWMNQYPNRVNDRNAIHDKEKKKQYIKQWNIDNKEKVKQYNIDNKEKKKEYNKQYHKQYAIDNKEKRKQYNKEYVMYQKTWGGDIRYNNNLLNIAIDLFSI